MTVIVGASAHGSPGVSTALQLLAAQWPNSRTVPVVIEADASGGVLAARYGISLTPGMVTLAESLRKGEQPNLLDHAQRLPSGVACVALSPSATASKAQLKSTVGFLGPYMQSVDHPVLVDAGTMLPDSRIATAVVVSDLLLWFVRPTREELLVLRHRISEAPQPDAVGIVLVGDAPYGEAEVQDALEVPVLGVLPVDARGAAAVNIGGDDRFLRRSPLTRACAKLAEQLQHYVWMATVDGGADDSPNTLDSLAPQPAEPASPVQEASVIDLSTLPPPPPAGSHRPSGEPAAADLH